MSSLMKYSCLMLCVLFVGCTFTNTRLNDQKDKVDAEVVTKKLYSYLKQRNYPETLTLFSDEFQKPATRKELLRIYQLTNQKIGTLQVTKLANWETKSMKGDREITAYIFQFNNQYDSSNAIETIHLSKSDKDPIKIVYYHINSDKINQP